jgi:hypothetical protein
MLGFGGAADQSRIDSEIYMEKAINPSRHEDLKTMLDQRRDGRMPTVSNDQKRKARIYKLTQALVEMRPSRRRGDVAALKRITRELEILRAAELRKRTTLA